MGVLEFFVKLFGGVCCLIALGHIGLGPQIIPGAVPVNATMDSEDRFYATLFLGFGAALIWCAQELRDANRTRLFGWLLVLFFAGGFARIISWLHVGPPHPLFIVLMGVELVLPPVLWFWHRSLVNPQP